MEKPMGSLLAQSLVDIIRSFPSTFMVGEKLKAVKTCLVLSKLNFKDSFSHKCASSINMSIPIKVKLSHLKAVKKVRGTRILLFKS